MSPISTNKEVPQKNYQNKLIKARKFEKQDEDSKKETKVIFVIIEEKSFHES